MISADEAYRWGIFDVVVEDASLDSTLDGIIEEIAHCAPGAIIATKMLLSALSDVDTVSISEDLVDRCYGRIYDGDDFKEGLTAFRERRQPNYRGR